MNSKVIIYVCILVLIPFASPEVYACCESPIASMWAYPNPACVGETITFGATGSYDPDCSNCSSCNGVPMIYGIRQFEWDWTNDGTYDYTESPGDGFATHSYSTAGSYTVKLKVYDGDSFCCCNGTGCSDKTATYTITVNVVKVDKIHVMPLPVTDWFDVTETTIVVLKGAIYTFKALPYPADAGWPSGTPVWSGIASGTGETINVTFNNVGTEFLMVGCRYTPPEKTVTINQVVLEPDEVSFLDYNAGEEHDIYGVSDPVWKRVNNPDNPASYTKNKYIKVGGKFWAPQNLTYSTEVYVDLQDQSTGWPFLSNAITVKNWPSARSDHRSTNRLADEIKTHQYTFKWRYKVASGTNQWIDMANSSGPHKVYAVYGPPQCSSSNYTEHHLDLVCDWAVGGVLVTENDIPKKIQENCFHNPGGPYLGDPWNLESTQGDCETHAELVGEAVKVLGIEAGTSKVGQSRFCIWHRATEWRYLQTVSHSDTNFETVCEVDLIDETTPWTCYYDKWMGLVNGAYQKGHHDNMWTEWHDYPPPHHKVIYEYYSYWQNHEP